MVELTDTQKKILETGKLEFLKKGFKDASLRGIVKEAGFTQGAFYGYYPDKSALFNALVAEPADNLVAQFRAAQNAHYDLIPEGRAHECRDLSTEYLNHFINYIYDNFDAFKLIICCAEGTVYADYVEDLVNIEVEESERYYSELEKLGKVEGKASHDLLHMITRAYFTAVFETVAHDMTREHAIQYVNELAVFFNCGWDGLLKLR